jgi:hypothetical protein
MIHLEQQRRCERGTVRYIIGGTIGEVGLIIATRRCVEGGDSQSAVGGGGPLSLSRRRWRPEASKVSARRCFLAIRQLRLIRELSLPHLLSPRPR